MTMIPHWRRRGGRAPRRLSPLSIGLVMLVCAVSARAQPASSAQQPAAVVARFVNDYCLDCHSSVEPVADLDLETRIQQPIEQRADVWESVIGKLSVRQMPPADSLRPDELTYAAALAALERILDRAAAKNPNPGRTGTFRRLTRTEYQNAVRDLLAIEVDAAALLPEDASSHGFDNITVADLSPARMDRYVSAALRISRLAIGAAGHPPGSETIRIPADRTQEQHVEGLPLGTRGGGLFPYHFPRSGEYEIEVRLARDRNEEVEGLHRPHRLELLLDRRRVGLFEIKRPSTPGEHAVVDRHLKTRIAVTAGPHELGAAFLQDDGSLAETLRQPYQARFNVHRHPRLAPAVFQISIRGPLDADAGAAANGEALETPSQRRVFVCRPTTAEDEEACARRILAELMRRAYRRPVTEEDLQTPLRLYREGRDQGGFDSGIEIGLAAILVSPHFLFRIERDPPAAEPGDVYAISDVELASRLSFFLWSSLPDDELLDLAERGELSRPEVLDQQVRRMLADRRSESLAANFAGQWLHLRNLDSFTPDSRLFPDFDDNLRQAFRRETELLFSSIVGEDRSVLDLLRSEYTYLDERLAKHYGIPHVYGSRFRRVTLEPGSTRGGLLRHGSILSVTSYATRTSPVIRGKWILENILGLPPSPPPPDVPDLQDNSVAASLPVRERLAAHRASPACASCHDLIDPLGFALENFDAVGRWRQLEADQPVDASGRLPDGTEFTGVEGLEAALLAHPEWFVRTLVAKLLTFSLGRGVDCHDAPAIRQIVRQARTEEYRFSSLVVGIARSVPFQMRRTE